jgi:predicted kinase
VRKDLVTGPDAYTDEWKAKTYATMLDRARVALTCGESVVLDASWTRGADRDAAARLAEETASDLIALRCTAPADVAAARAARRLAAGLDASEAGADVARLLATRADPWPAAVEVDTTGNPDHTLAAALAAVAPAR